eukprot:s324_g7.t1
MAQLEWETRCLNLSSDLKIHVYFPTQPTDQNIQVEWSLNDVTAWIWMSENVEKRRDKYKNHSAGIEAVYQHMYGEPPPKPRQCRNQTTKVVQEVMMYERTVSTKYVAAMLCFAISNPNFGEDQMFRLYSLTSKFLAHLCQVQPFQDKPLSILCLGDGPNTFETLVAGRVPSIKVWPDVIRSALEEVWADATRDNKRPWYKSTCENMSIPEFILFGLDACNTRTLSFLRIAAEDALKQVFGLLTPRMCHEWTSEPETLKPAGTTKKVRKGIRVQGYFTACKFIASGEEFDVDMLESIFEPEYQLYVIRVDCADVGHFGMSRKRTYVILRHVETTDCLYDPSELYEEVKQYITARVQTEPCDYMIATPEEVALEAQHVASVRKIRYRPGLQDLTYLLNEREHETLQVACTEYKWDVDEQLETMKNEYIRLGSVVAGSKMTKELAWQKSEKTLLEAARKLVEGDKDDPGAAASRALATPAPDASVAAAAAVSDADFDDLVMEAKSLGLGDYMDKDNTPALAQRLKRMLEKRKSESLPQPGDGGDGSAPKVAKAAAPDAPDTKAPPSGPGVAAASKATAGTPAKASVAKAAPK